MKLNALKIILTIGLALMAVGLWTLINSNEFVENGLQVEGTVVELRTELTKTDGNTSTLYRPVFEFTTQEGKLIKYSSPISSNPPAFQEGEKVTVVYDPSNPTNATTMTYWGLYRGTTICLIVSSVLIFIGGIGLFTER